MRCETIQLRLERIAARNHIQETEYAVAGGGRRDDLLILQISQRDRSAAQSESRRIAKDSLERRGLCGYLARKALLLSTRGERAQAQEACEPAGPPFSKQAYS